MANSTKAKDEARKANRQPTPEELAEHKKNLPNVLEAIRRDHRKTQIRVERLTSGIMYKDKG